MKRSIKHFFTFQILLITIISSAQKTSDPVVNSVNCGTLSNALVLFPADWCDDAWILVSEASDEFNGSQVDLTKWAYAFGAVIDPFFPNKANGQVHAGTLGSSTTCHYQEGKDGANGDLAYYTFGNNHEVSNGTLKIFIKQETLTAKAVDYELDNTILADGLPNLRTWQFTSGSLVSRQKYSIGRYEISCKLPKIDGLWPAFWMYGEHEQEIDILESGNKNFNEDKDISSKAFGAATHRNPTNPFQSSSGGHDNHCHTNSTYNSIVDLSSGFHTYSLEWNAFEVIFKIDNFLVYKYTALYDPIGSGYIGYAYNTACNLGTGGYQWLLDVLPTASETMNIILNCGVQNFCSPQNPLSRGTYPATMEIDYIRAYKQLPPCDAEDIAVTNTPPFSSNLLADDLKAHNSIITFGTTPLVTAANRHWTAGNYIDFNPGFETFVGAGAVFVAEIADCDNTNLRIISSDSTTQSNPVVLQNSVSHGKNPAQEKSEQEKANSNSSNNLISPNPTSGIFTLMSSSEVQNIEVRDMLGKIVYSKKVNDDKINIDIDLSSQPKGIYILQVQSADKIYTEKVVVQ